MHAELGYAIIAPDALAQTLAHVRQYTAWCAWLEDPLLQIDPHGLRLRIDVASDEALQLPVRWPAGRIFHENFDLRWERQADTKLHLVAIADTLPAPFRTPPPLALTRIIRPDADSTGNEYLLLWGERPYRGADVWGDGRIPDLKRFYQGWKGPQAAIAVRTYESTWIYDPAMPPAVRTVTRYLCYVSDYQAPYDPRLL